MTGSFRVDVDHGRCQTPRVRSCDGSRLATRNTWCQTPCSQWEMASSTSRRAARRAGSRAATTPATAATSTTTRIAGTGTEKVETNVAGSALDHAVSEQQPEPDAERRAEQRHEGGLEAHHPADLAAGHADRTNQPELPRALEHRQGERVADADQGDHDGQRDHRVDHRQDLVDHAGHSIAELVGGLDRRRTGTRRRARRRTASLLACEASSAKEKASHSAVGCDAGGCEHAGVEQVVLAEDRLVVEHADDRGVTLMPASRLDGDGVAQLGAGRLRLVGRHDGRVRDARCRSCLG